MKAANTMNPYNRLALFGGSFDPIHCAHLQVANAAMQQAQLDSVIFIPNAQSPLKHSPLSPADARLKMLRLALQDEHRFSLDTYKMDQGGVNFFTVNTVEHFKERYRDAQLFWIIGGDQFVQLDQWFRIDTLASMIIFLVYPRLEDHQSVFKKMQQAWTIKY